VREKADKLVSWKAAHIVNAIETQVDEYRKRPKDLKVTSVQDERRYPPLTVPLFDKPVRLVLPNDEDAEEETPMKEDPRDVLFVDKLPAPREEIVEERPRWWWPFKRS
jgi:hypothetical protein